MRRHIVWVPRSLVECSFIALCLASVGGCSQSTSQPISPGTGGNGSGGLVGTGGAVGSGGTLGTGGSATGTGGKVGTGGSPGTGGSNAGTGGAGSGGSIAGTGGIGPGTGGTSTVASGGAKATGGTMTGGQPGTGGIVAAGGGGGRGGATTGAGGSSSGTSIDGGPGGTGSLGCGKALTRPDPKVQQTMDIQGTTRYYLLDVSTSADNKTPLMLIFALHGHNMNNVSVVGLYNFTSRSGGKAITVYPQGDGDAPGTTSKWGSGITSNWTSNDANYTYIQTLKADLESRFCIDTSREFFTGFSMGGMFTNSIACAHNSWFRGFAPVEGMGPGSCADANAKPAIMIHQGTADTTVTPTAGGEPTRDFWLKQNGCNQTTTSGFTGCQSYGACAQPVIYCVGNWNHTIDSIAAGNIWSFFNGLQ